MSESTVCFVNSSTTNERIRVTDAHSAEILKKILGRLENEKWVVEGQAEAAPAEVIQEALFDLNASPELPPEQATAKAFRVILISGTSTFRSSVLEVSTSGMTLKNAAPFSFIKQKDCVAYVTHADARENIEVACEVSSELGITRIGFVGADALTLEKLSSWIGAHA